MPSPPPAYASMEARAREVALLSSTSAVLAWDQETGMPAKALEYRASQLSHLSGLTHRLLTAPEVGDWIRACEEHGFPPASPEAANLREWRRQYDRQTRLPTSLVEEFHRTTSLAREAWADARRRSEFPLFSPHLTRILELRRRMVDAWGYETSPYDALLEEYEPGARTSQLQSLFAELRPAIVQLLKPASERSERVPKDLLDGDYPVSAQETFNREVASALGYDFGAGRIDSAVHPFCTTLGPRDCRLTTRYNERDFTSSLYSTLHEVGHGLYEQGLAPESFGTPMGSAASLGIHESQSRLWENHVGRSLEFWDHWFPVACRHFPALKRLSPAQVCAAVSRVSRSYIRTEADEVTYDLHIVLRFEIELQMLEGRLQVADVPAYWNEEFMRMFGLPVPDDAHGCLQDIHWSLGDFGYFPTYTLGNLNASQLVRAAHKANPQLDEDLRHGRYSALLGWLRRHIHQPGQSLRPSDLMRAASSEPTRASCHLEYLRQKYLP